MSSEPRATATGPQRALLLAATDRPAEAERHAREAATIFEAAFGAMHWLAADARSVLGACLLDLEQIDDAAPLSDHRPQILESSLGDRSRPTREARCSRQRLRQESAPS